MGETPISRMVLEGVRCVKCGAQGVGTCSCWSAPEPVLPWCDSPRCPRCRRPQGVPVEMSGLRAYPGDTLICAACGLGWVGTPEQEGQAWLAELQWLFKQEADAENAGMAR